MSDTPTLNRQPLRERTAEEIRSLLARRRMSAAHLGRLMGVSQAYVWRRLTGETAFDLNDLEAIAEILEVAVVDLLPSDARRTVQDKSGTLPRPDRPTDNRPSGRPDRRVTTPGGPRRTRRIRHPGQVSPAGRAA
jgi:transcriptional regulator with XRE-family HTH domain